MIYDNRQCTLGEGPLWHPERQQFFWFDIIEKRLHTKGQHWQFDGHVSAAGWVDQDTLIIASDTALHRFDIPSGDHNVICPLEADLPGNRSNDGRADPQGGFWIGTMGLNAEQSAGAIYRYYKGELRKIFPDITITNAICFAPDGKTAFFCDTPTQQILRVSLDADGWPTDTPQIHIDLSDTDYRPDGAVIDAAGNLWNAQWGAHRVATYDPAGNFLRATDFPATQTSCPAFGGDNLQTLFCTSAAIGLSSDNPDQGKVFAVKTDTVGQREHQVIL